MAAVSLANYWHPVATSAEVTDKPRQVILLDEKIVVFRSQNGVSAFKDLCIHRGAALSAGTVTDGNIVCPYHGWRYDGAGRCVHIPALQPGASIPSKARAIAYKAREAYGLVWVAMAEPVQGFPEWPEDAWNRPDFRVCYVDQYTWQTSAGRAVEAALDFSHFNFVHKGYTELADGPVIKPYEVKRTPRGLRYVYEDTRLRRDYELDFPFIVHDRKSVIATDKGGTWSEGANAKLGDVTLLSFLSSPVTAKTTTTYVFTARNHSLDVPDEQFTSGFDVIMDQDRQIVEAQRPEEIPADIREELHLKLPDAASIAYRKLLRDLTGGDAARA